MLPRRFGLALVALVIASGACAAPPDDEAASTEGALSGTGPSGSTPAAGAVLDCQVLVVGGGTGGMGAAIAAARVGMKTCVTEETDWVGGQLTAQGLTRAQAAVALTRALGIDAVAPNGLFGDVPAAHWAAGSVEALAAKGIVTGTRPATFGPDAAVTGEQLRAMLGRALGDDVARNAVASSLDATALNRGQAAQALVRSYRARLHLP